MKTGSRLCGGVTFGRRARVVALPNASGGDI
jgi:hypothetical protein